MWVSAKIGTCNVVSVNVTLAEAKMCAFTLESTHFIFNQCPIYTHDGASATLQFHENYDSLQGQMFNKHFLYSMCAGGSHISFLRYSNLPTIFEIVCNVWNYKFILVIFKRILLHTVLIFSVIGRVFSMSTCPCIGYQQKKENNLPKLCMSLTWY